MRARLGLLTCFAMFAGMAAGCTRDNPAFSEPTGTGSDADSETTDVREDIPTESGEETPAACNLMGGMDMTIEVPQPCGENNAMLGTYDHWLHVVEAAESTWTVQFCNDPTCTDCEVLAGDLVLSPLPLSQLAGPGACLLMQGRRLGTGDDCNYHAVTIQDMGADGAVLVVARRTELLDLPPLASNTGLLGWEPNLVVHETCDCAETPDACCGDQAPTLYAYDINGTLIPIGLNQGVTLGQRDYQFWAFNAFHSGECDTPIDVSWALTAK
jgi:hypothetical protein